MLYGIDISHANPDFDMHAAVAEGNLSFIALKGTEGRDWVDPTVVDRYNRIVRYLPNIFVILYHFLRTDSPAADQMAHFYGLLKQLGYFDNPRTLAPAIDAERGLQGQEPSTSLTVASIGELRRLSGSLPGLYSGADYWASHFANVEACYDWVARFGKLQPGIGFDLWQDSDKREIAGNAYDHNVFYGTAQQLTAKCGK